MPASRQSPSHRAAMKAVVTNESGSDERECLISEATSGGCRLTGNVDGLPDVICIQVSGVAKPMKGRIVSRDPGSAAVSFSWSRAPQAVDREDAAAAIDPAGLAPPHPHAGPQSPRPAQANPVAPRTEIRFWIAREFRPPVVLTVSHVTKKQAPAQ